MQPVKVACHPMEVVARPRKSGVAAVTAVATAVAVLAAGCVPEREASPEETVGTGPTPAAVGGEQGRLSDTLGASQNAMPPSAPASAPPIGTLDSNVYEYEFRNSDGFTATVSVTVGQIRRAVADARSGTTVLGSACRWNTDTDGAVPITIALTNTTPDWTTRGVVYWGLTYSKAVPDFGKIEAEITVSSGSVCYDIYKMAPSGTGFAWDEMSPNMQRTGSAFIRVPNYIAPSRPDGDLERIAGMRIEIKGVELNDTRLGTSDERADVHNHLLVPFTE